MRKRMLRSYRLPWVTIALAVLIVDGCGTAPAPAKQAKPDETRTAAYREAVERLGQMTRQAEAAYHAGKSDLAAEIMDQEKPLVRRVLAVPQPTLAATEAASDLDQLYGTMLLANRHYGWAHILFQGNVTRWKHWRPATEETARRLKQAESAVAECDRRLAR